VATAAPLSRFILCRQPARATLRVLRWRYGPAGARSGTQPTETGAKGKCRIFAGSASIGRFSFAQLFLRPRLSSRPFMAHPSGWSNHAQAKQQTVQCSNATVVHAAAWQVQLAERD